MGGSNGDGPWRGLVTIVELIDPRPFIFKTLVHGSLIYTVIYMSDGLLTQANPNPHLTPLPPDLRRPDIARHVIRHTLIPRFLSPLAYYDAASMDRQSLPATS